MGRTLRQLNDEDLSLWAVSGRYDPAFLPPFLTYRPLASPPAATHYWDPAGTGAASGTGTLASPWNPAGLVAACTAAGALDTATDGGATVVVEATRAGTARVAIPQGFTLPNAATGQKLWLRAPASLVGQVRISGADVIASASVVSHTRGTGTGTIPMFKFTMGAGGNPAQTVFPDSPDASAPLRYSSRSLYQLFVDGLKYKQVADSSLALEADRDAANLTTLENKTTGGWFMYHRSTSTYYVVPMAGGYWQRTPNTPDTSTTAAYRLEHLIGNILADHQAGFASRVIEVANRTYCFGEGNTDGGAKDGWCLDGVWAYGASPNWQKGMVNLAGRSRARFVRAYYSHGVGIRVNTGAAITDHESVGCRTDHNGLSGYSIVRTTGVGGTVTDWLSDKNGIEGYNPVNEGGGCKFAYSVTHISNWINRENESYGLWKDLDNFAGSTRNGRSHDNHRSGYSNEVGQADILENYLGYHNAIDGDVNSNHAGCYNYVSPVLYQGFIVLVRNQINEVVRDDSRMTTELTARDGHRHNVISVAYENSAAQRIWKYVGDAVGAFLHPYDPKQTSGNNRYYITGTAVQHYFKSGVGTKNNLADVRTGVAALVASDQNKIFEVGSTETTITAGASELTALYAKYAIPSSYVATPSQALTRFYDVS